MRGRSPFREPVTWIRYDVGLPGLVVRHLPLQEICDGRPVLMAVKGEGTAGLQRDLAHSQWTTDCRLHLSRQIQRPEQLLALTDVRRRRLALSGRVAGRKDDGESNSDQHPDVKWHSALHVATSDEIIEARMATSRLPR